MQRQKLFLIIGVALSAIAMVLIWQTIQQEKINAQKKAEEVIKQQLANATSVLVAKRDIPRGTTIDPQQHLDTKVIANSYVEAGAQTSDQRVAGMVAGIDIPQGQQITINKLVSSGTATGGLASATPVGKRAITISVDNIASLAGMLRPGNRVDLIALLPIPAQGADGKQANQLATFPLFQNILVLAVGQETGAVEAPVGRYTEKKETTGGTPLITLALAPQEANLVTFVQEQGKMRLILRSPSDPKVESLRPATWESLFAYVMPPPPPPPPKVEAPKEYIEIYRGLKRDKIEVAK